MLVTDLNTIRKRAEACEEENVAFRGYVKCELDWDDERFDAMVHDIAWEVMAGVDCARCGNCCKTMQAGLTAADIHRLAAHLRLSPAEFTARYVVKDFAGDAMLGAMPCPFYAEQHCTVKDVCPTSCRDYPNLLKKDMRARMLSMIFGAADCPIIFNTLERLKEAVGWRSRSHARSPLR